MNPTFAWTASGPGWDSCIDKPGPHDGALGFVLRRGGLAPYGLQLQHAVRPRAAQRARWQLNITACPWQLADVTDTETLSIIDDHFPASVASTLNLIDQLSSVSTGALQSRVPKPYRWVPHRFAAGDLLPRRCGRRTGGRRLSGPSRRTSARLAPTRRPQPPRSRRRRMLSMWVTREADQGLSSTRT
jgi:hypothetical protein